MARQKIVLEFILPAGERIQDAPALLEWFALSIARARLQSIDSELYIDGKKENVAMSIMADGEKPS